MAYRVRNQDGEISFPQFADLEKAYREKWVDPDDEVLEDGNSKWVKAGSIKLLQGVRDDHTGSLFTHPSKRWYAIAGVLVAVGAIMLMSRSWLVAGCIGALVLFGLMAYTTKLGIKRKRSG